MLLFFMIQDKDRQTNYQLLGSADSTWGKLIVLIYYPLLEPQVTLSPFPAATSSVGPESATVRLQRLVLCHSFLLTLFLCFSVGPTAHR